MKGCAFQPRRTASRIYCGFSRRFSASQPNSRSDAGSPIAYRSLGKRFFPKALYRLNSTATVVSTTAGSPFTR